MTTVEVTRYELDCDHLEPEPDGRWVAYDDVAHLFDRRSLRDWFAGQALNAIIEDVNRPSDSEQGESQSDEHPRAGIARRAYAIADAMLAERAKAGTP